MKNPNAKQYGQIYFHDIGDYLSREEKLEKISDLVSINGITTIDGWTTITPDEHNDWLNQRDDSFSEFIEIGNKKDITNSLFKNYTNGVVSSRDAFAYNFSRKNINLIVNDSLKFYSTCIDNNVIDNNPTKISWSVNLKKSFEKKSKINFNSNEIRVSSYRPFTKSYIYFDKNLIERRNQLPNILPFENLENKLILLSGVGSSKGFSVFIASHLFDFQTLSNCQGFPLYLYEENTVENKVNDLFNQTGTQIENGKYSRKDAISDTGLKHFQDTYPTETISKEDIFYYVYGLLHSEDYRTRYADNLSKELPRIPCVKKAEDFWAFSKAGRDLAHWHLNYETVEPYKAKLDLGSKSLKQLEDKDFYVTKMKFPKKDQKDTVIYNNAITIREIPLEAYDYVVNGKSALEWVMERQGVSTHKDSGIVNDANDWAIETMGNAKYPLELFLRVITVSLETMKIVKNLPKLDI